MEWIEIREQYPDQFILLGDLVEEQISENEFRILGGNVLKVSSDAKEIRKAFREFSRQGKEVLYSLPTTPSEFIVEDVTYHGLLR